MRERDQRRFVQDCNSVFITLGVTDSPALRSGLVGRKTILKASYLTKVIARICSGPTTSVLIIRREFKDKVSQDFDKKRLYKTVLHLLMAETVVRATAVTDDTRMGFGGSDQ